MLERPRDVRPQPVGSARWAWLAMLGAVIVYPLALVVGLSNQEGAWWGDLFVVVLVLLPPAAGVALGVRAGLTGNQSGALASMIGAAWVTFMMVFYVADNYIWDGKATELALAFAAGMVILVVGAMQSAWHRVLPRSHTAK